jgi:hypothetical protein
LIAALQDEERGEDTSDGAGVALREARDRNH